MFYWWGYQWANPLSETQHGWLILGLSCWLFWRNARAEPAAPNPAVPGRASAAMAAGVLLHVLGYGMQQTRLSILGALCFLWGVLALAGGRRWGRAAAFPLAFMVFAVPVNLLDTAGFWLRLWVIGASSALAHAAGIEVIRNGTQLIAPGGGYHYDVAAACSGVRSLVALTALSLLVGYLNFRTWWLRVLVMALSFPFTYLGNVVRIAAIIFAAQWFGEKAGLAVHEWAGFLVFVIVVGLVLAGVSGLRRLFPRMVAPASPVPAPFWVRAVEGVGWWRSPWCAAVIAAGLVAAGVAGMRRLDAVGVRSGCGIILAADGVNPAGLPAFIGTDWIGRRVEVSAVEREILPPDTGFSRRIYAALHQPGHAVLLSIVLSGRDRSSIHRPELCLTGQGWTIGSRALHRFRLPGRPGEKWPATVLQIEHAAGRDGKRHAALLAYWFVSSNRVAATYWERMAWGAWDRLRHGRADRWAYVLLQADAADGEAAALARMQEVLDGTLPAFLKSRGKTPGEKA
jgi:EpsI family protein